METERIKPTADGVKFKVRVQPRASRNQVVGWMADHLRIRLTAPPLEGEANDQLVSFLAQQLGVPRASIRLLAGRTSRSKVIEVKGLKVEDLTRSLNC